MSSAEDERAIERLLVRYAWAIDTWDATAAVACFTPDGRLVSAAGADVHGAAELLAFLSSGRTGGRFGQMEDRELLRTSHVMGNVESTIDADTARTRSACTSFTLAREGHDECLIATGLRYHDDLIRTVDGWRIACRELDLQWTFELARRKVVGSPTIGHP